MNRLQRRLIRKTRGNYPAADAILDVIRYGLENGFDKVLRSEAKRFSELLMGAGISHVSVAKAKVPVRIKDVSNEGVLNALNYNYKVVRISSCRRRILSRSGLESKMLQLSGGIDFTSFNHTDVVIEAVQRP